MGHLQAIQILVQDDRDQVIAVLWELGTVGLVENANSLEAFFPDTTDLQDLRQQYAARIGPVQSVSAVEQESFTAQDAEPVFAGEKVFIVPPGSSAITPPGRLRIEIEAHNAFGSGRHESTQLVITELERHLRRGSIVLDVGSGSGVLAAVASKLGAEHVFACDTHGDSAVLTRRHAPHAHVFAGSIDSVQSSSADLVVANISARVIDRLSFHLARITKPGGLLILAGFIASRTPRFFHPQSETALDEWRCWICTPKLQSSSESDSPSELQPFEEEWW